MKKAASPPLEMWLPPILLRVELGLKLVRIITYTGICVSATMIEKRICFLLRFN